MNKLEIDYNSTYISSNLIDELDYVIGGYGKPNPVFIYSLNAFLEAFILNSSFYISSQELMHIQIISKSLFPGGRPILELLSKTNSLRAIGGIGNDIGQVISIDKFDSNNPTTYQERVQHFINNGIETTKARKEYLVLPNIEEDVTKLSYLNIGKVDGGLIATVSYNSPQEFYKKLSSATNDTNIQATLPFYSYKYQIEEIQKRGIGREIITNLSDSFHNKQQKVSQYFGYTNQTIPPLVTILLTQCKDISDIPTKMLQLREDFTKLRDSIVTYEKRINEARDIKEQIEAIDELNEFWKVFNKKYSENRRLLYQFWEVAKDSKYEDSVDNAIDTGDASDMIKDLNAGKVIGKGAKKIFDWYKEKKIINRFRGVTDIWNLFEKTPNIKKHLSEYERLFNVKLDSFDLETLNNKINQIKFGKSSDKDASR
jgi:hypothetical protein